jgi:hypothetical protein
MKTMICIGFLLFALSAAYAQVIPINHNMKNLKVGNAYIYRSRLWVFRSSGRTLDQDSYSVHRIIRYDTLDNRQYAVYNQGYRERADSSGVYWIPKSFDNTKSFTGEFLRYPLLPSTTNTFTLLNCVSIISSTCYPLDHPLYRPKITTISRNRENNTVFGVQVQRFFLGYSYVELATIFGYLVESGGTSFTSYLDELCGAVIEGKYYGDSACLIASSTPLQGAEFTTLTASLAPNPVSDIATIRFILPTAQGLTVEICDMLGRQLAPPMVFDALSSGMNALPIDVSSIPRGVYAVRLRTALGLRATTMFVKE